MDATNTLALEQSTQRASPKRYATASVVFFIALLGISYMFNSADRQVFPALLVTIRKAYGLTLPEAGFVSTVFTFNVAIFAALSGWFMARYGRRAILLGGLIGYSLFTFATPLAGNYFSLITFRALTGIGEALQVGAVFACMGAYFGVHRGAAMGVMQAFFGLGAFLGPILGTRIEAASQSWSLSFYVFGIAGLVVAGLAAWFIPKDFTNAGEEDRQATAQSDGPSGEPTRLLSVNLLLTAAAFAMVGLSFFSYAGLYASFLHNERGFTIVEAGSALGMYGIGAIGGALGGWLGDRAGRLGTLAALFILGSSGYLLFHLETSLWVHSALSLTFGLMQSGFLFPRLISLAQYSCPAKSIGYAGSIALAGFYVPGAFAGLLFGAAVNAWGWAVASTVMVTLPPMLGVVMLCFYDFSKARAREHGAMAAVH